jgi:hypothetical protein
LTWLSLRTLRFARSSPLLELLERLSLCTGAISGAGRATSVTGEIVADAEPEYAAE